MTFELNTFQNNTVYKKLVYVLVTLYNKTHHIFHLYTTSTSSILQDSVSIEIEYKLRVSDLMTKVYPNAVVPVSQQPPVSVATQTPLVLTIWKKSLLFNCHGFTVFDSNGNLVYRVDNYNSGTNPEIVLMDASGTSLLTIRRKRLSLMENWLIYDGETAVNPLMTVTKHVNVRKSKSVAHVTLTGSREKKVTYDIEGSYRQRSCVVYDEKRRCVVEIKPKEAVGGVTFGGDVFRLFVQPEIDPSVAMAILVVLDQMFP